MIKKLKLTKKQIKQLRKTDFSSREKRLEYSARLDDLRLQMDKSFSENAVDKKTVLQLAKNIADIKGKLFIQGIELRFLLDELLNDDQIQKLKTYVARPRRHHPGYGERQVLRRRSP